MELVLYAMDSKTNILFSSPAEKLWQAAQMQGAMASSGESVLAVVNEWRAMQFWPLCTSMLPGEPPVYEAIGTVDDETRSLWQMGLLHYLKKVGTGKSVLRRALVGLSIQQNTLLGKMALLLDYILISDFVDDYPHAIEQCFSRFDRLLKQCESDTVDMMMAHMLWQDLYFYGSEHFISTTESVKDLQKRVKYVAKQMAEMLVVRDTEDTIKKAILFPLYLSLTDGLLFLKKEQVLQRTQSLFNAIEEPKMLCISVPVQKLWAQCISLGV